MLGCRPKWNRQSRRHQVQAIGKNPVKTYKSIMYTLIPAANIIKKRENEKLKRKKRTFAPFLHP